MALQLRSQLCTFENSTNCNEISFDPHSFSELLKGLLQIPSLVYTYQYQDRNYHFPERTWKIVELSIL